MAYMMPARLLVGLALSIIGAHQAGAYLAYV
jgi:hypothetical protein